MKQYDPKQAIENADLVAKQRRMEVAIRRAKRQLNAAITIDNKEDVQHFKQLIRRRQGALRIFINEHDQLLRRDYSREQVYT